MNTLLTHYLYTIKHDAEAAPASFYNWWSLYGLAGAGTIEKPIELRYILFSSVIVSIGFSKRAAIIWPTSQIRLARLSFFKLVDLKKRTKLLVLK